MIVFDANFLIYFLDPKIKDGVGSNTRIDHLVATCPAVKFGQNHRRYSHFAAQAKRKRSSHVELDAEPQKAPQREHSPLLGPR